MSPPRTEILATLLQILFIASPLNQNPGYAPDKGEAAVAWGETRRETADRERERREAERERESGVAREKKRQARTVHRGPGARAPSNP